MTSRLVQTTLLAAIALLTLSGEAQPASPPPYPTPSLATLRQDFLNPPNAARPMVRWWWFGVAVQKPEILTELQQMKANGIGGAELAFVYPEVLNDPAKHLINYPFLSPEMLDAVNFAQSEGRKLGLRIDITLCSGWPYGGPATPLAQAAAHLRVAEVAVPAGATSVTAPTLAEGESILSAAIADSLPTPVPPAERGRSAPPPRVGWDLATAKPLTLAGSGSQLIVPSSANPRTAIFFVSSHTLQQVKRAAVGAEGYVLDPFSREAVATHLRAVGEPLLSAFGSNPPYAIFSDSLEAYGADWTPTLPAEFLKRRGYDLIPHLPELAAGGTPAAEKVRHDYGRTLTELVDENYLTQINDWANTHKTKFRSQTYGEPAVSLASQRLVALPEGEGPQWRAFSTLRWATSGNHLLGNGVTSGETFTWLHSPVFRATPLDMKAEADIDFIMGENQLIFHGWPYSPPASELKPGDPGWSLYAAAVFNDHNPWHPVMPAVTQYIARLSWLLRQGKPANQVAVLLPTDDAWASFSPGHTSVTDAMKTLISPDLMATILSAGYNVDYIDAKAIDTIGLGDHQILVIPPTERIPVETMKKLHLWDNTEGQVICYQRCPSLDAEGKTLPPATAPFILANDTAALTKDLHDAKIPDLTLGDADASSQASLGFIHRKLNDADVYLVVNTSNRPLAGTAHFATSFKGGHEWNPETGRVMSGGVLPDLAFLNLAPYGSAVYVFTAGNVAPVEIHDSEDTIADLTNDWHLHFTALDKSITAPTLTDWTSDPATLHYSGEGVYSRDFTLAKLPTSPTYLAIEGGTALPGAPNSTPEHDLLPNGLPNPLVTRTGPGMHAYFDPPIHEAALVTINGQPAGALWHPPYRLDVTKLLKPGVNHIEIHVYNTALNAWSALPAHDYGPLKAKYGDRFQMQDLEKVKPVPSGILGTIKLVTEGPQITL
jgi:hypothetical protein